ncbi:MAG: extracellular solute-binding protein, partial [Clostridiales bacterium]|nr:extracellular solute-binding protein [Clostridiales bacterium]
PSSPFPQVQATNVWKQVYNTDIVVDVVAESTATEYLSTAVASGTSPDMIPIGFTTYPLWPARGLTANLEDEKLAGYLDLDNPVFIPEMMEKFRFQGKLMAAVTTQPELDYLVYNKSKFHLAGETTPMEHYKNGNWNWSQFVKTAKAMTSGDDYGFTGWGLFPYQAPYPMLNLNDDGTVSLNLDDTKYMTWMTEVYNFYQREKAGRLDYNLQSWSSNVPQGTDAMVYTTLYGFERLVKVAQELEGDEFGIAPTPIFNPAGETERIWTANVWAYSISSGALCPEAAATYIRLEALVAQQIRAAQYKYGILSEYMDNYLTDDEKQMILDTADEECVVDMIRGIGDCYDIVDSQMVPKIYYNVNDASVQAEIDAVKPLLQAEFDDYNNDLRDREEQQG